MSFVFRARQLIIGVSLVAAVMFRTASAAGYLSWIQGRFNGSVMASLLLLCMLLCWMFCVFGLCIYVALNLWHCRRARLAVGTLLLIVVLSPWTFLIDVDRLSLLQDGFAEWTNVHVDVAAILPVLNTVNLNGTDKEVPLWWPTENIGQKCGLPLPERQRTPVLGSLHADTIRITLMHPSLIFAWEGHRTNLTRFLVVGPPGVVPPDVLATHVAWRQTGTNTWIGIAIPP